MHRIGAFLGAALLATVVDPLPAGADPAELMPCRMVSVKFRPGGTVGNGITKFVCRGTFALPSAGAAPTAATIDVNIVPPGTDTFGLPGIVPCVGLGNPAGSRGYRCKDEIRDLVVIRTNVVKGVFQRDIPAYHHAVQHPYPPGIDVAIRVAAYGVSDSKEYCGRFGGPPAVKDTTQIYVRRNAPAPTACSPSGAFLGDDASR